MVCIFYAEMLICLTE